MTSIDDLRALYQDTKERILDHPLTVVEQQALADALAKLPGSPKPTTVEDRLAQVYRELISASLTSLKYQLFYVANLNHDQTWLAYPIEPARVAQWRKSEPAKLTLFTDNAFLYDGLSVDETVAIALI